MASAKPHLTSAFRGFEFDFQAAGLDLKTLLQGQLLLVASDATGVLLATEVQPASALDALYADSAVTLEYGALVNPDGSTTFRLWAPTAQAVSLIPYGADKQAKTPIAMGFDPSQAVGVPSTRHWRMAITIAIKSPSITLRLTRLKPIK